jgi:hypothetical protein
MLISQQRTRSADPSSSATLSNIDLIRWFREYRRREGTRLFFEEYRDRVNRRGDPGIQNFLMGSELVRHHEVQWCCVLYWLVNPQSCPTLATSFLCKIVTELAKAPWCASKTHVVGREKPNQDGSMRFDITLENDLRRVVIEAKVRARIDKNQLKDYCAQLHDRDFFGLLITGDDQFDGSKSPCDQWMHCTWRHIAQTIKACLSENTERDLQRPDERRWQTIAEDFAEFVSLRR